MAEHEILENVKIGLSLPSPFYLKKRGIREFFYGFSDRLIRERNVRAELGQARVTRPVIPGITQERHVDQLGVGADGQPEDVVRNAGEPSSEKLILDYYVCVIIQLCVRTWSADRPKPHQTGLEVFLPDRDQAPGVLVL